MKVSVESFLPGLWIAIFSLDFHMAFCDCIQRERTERERERD